MALQFIMGNAGSGKSTWLYQRIVQQATREPRRNFYVIVPEQFTMQTQRELVTLQAQHGIMNIDVVSFQRLAYRVFDELGKQDVVVLEETGKNLVLRKVAQNKQDELVVLQGNMKKMGYISEIKSLISELTQYNVSVDALESFLEESKLTPSFRYKMQDVLTMYQGFEEYMQGKYITAEEVLGLLINVAKESGVLKDAVLALDGFTGFTPIQNEVLRELMTVVSDIYVTVTIDAKEDAYRYQDMMELFAMSKKTVTSLMKMADSVQVDVADPVLLEEGASRRFTDSSMLYFLEQNLFRSRHKTYQMTEEDRDIRIASLTNPREELRYVAGEVKRLVREEGYRYRDIAVVSGDVERYGYYVPQIFDDYEIPYFLDTTKNIILHPFIEFVRAVIEVIDQDFSYESVFRYLRTDLTGMTEADVDLLENYVLAAGVRGHKKWSNVFAYCPKSITTEQLEQVNLLRKMLMDQFTEVYPLFHNKDVIVKEQVIGLYQFIVGRDMERQLKAREVKYQEQGDMSKAKEYAQIYRIVMDLFEKMVSLLGDEILTVKEFSDILDAGFDAAKVGVIPGGFDHVLVGDIERSRLEHIKILFFVGVNDGIVPKADNSGGIISQLEREEMAKRNLELAPTARERVFIQRFYLYLTLTKPSQRLYLTYARVSSEGEALKKSYLIGTIRKLFAGLSIQEIEQIDTMESIVTPRSSIPLLIEGLRGEEEPEKEWRALIRWFEENKEYQSQLTRLIQASASHYVGDPISTGVSRALYGTVLENSVTRLERFAACACSHFLNYGVGLKEREMNEFASLDMGNIYHQALENYSKYLAKSDTDWFGITEDRQQAYVEAAMKDAIAADGNQALAATARNSYLLRRMTKIFERTIWALTEQIRRGRFTPAGFEVAFAFTKELHATNFTLSDEEKMRLRGRIDRVDTYESDDKLYVKVIDYKSGNTSFELLSLYHGLQLQLVVYMNAAMELVAKQHPDKLVTPAGIFYYHVDDPIVDANGHESEAEIYEKVLEKLKLNGIVNDEQENYEAMDTHIAGNSSVIPIGLNKDGSLKKTSKAVPEEDFAVIQQFVNEKIRQAGTEILSGEVKANPYQLGTKEGCAYCSYRSVCGYDARIPGYEHHRLEKIDKEEDILDKMKQVVEGE